MVLREEDNNTSVHVFLKRSNQLPSCLQHMPNNESAPVSYCVEHAPGPLTHHYRIPLHTPMVALRGRELIVEIHVQEDGEQYEAVEYE